MPRGDFNALLRDSSQSLSPNMGAQDADENKHVVDYFEQQRLWRAKAAQNLQKRNGKKAPGVALRDTATLKSVEMLSRIHAEVRRKPSVREDSSDESEEEVQTQISQPKSENTTPKQVKEEKGGDNTSDSDSEDSDAFGLSSLVKQQRLSLSQESKRADSSMSSPASSMRPPTKKKINKISRMVTPMAKGLVAGKRRKRRHHLPHPRSNTQRRLASSPSYRKIR
eukprot:CAMPEP_0114495800 /NCGR_PEP_ID=MMETSP0109-20121206/5417_1 /TAXON_ID=29199 /ORGANISM="Chlorarachnion reptans, Strain CCCM449" /LENGTH=223 /DNA_ID=CAMNT_0001673005 /DNA_START=171 /DNA_END=842 /DNA_ORIENTATION=-